VLDRVEAQKRLSMIYDRGKETVVRDNEEAVEHAKGELGTVKKSIAAMASR
jgi:hypothetical protein